MALPNFTENELQDAIDAGYVGKRKHPEFGLWILNYTPKCQFDGVWNNVTRQCRGLILNSRFEIVSRPFQKFFNFHEHIAMGGQIPNEAFTVYDKLDGSLGITYFGPDSKARIATRGSFESPQAIRGTELFKDQFCCKVLDPSITYLFEIICADSTYVVDYKGWEGLVLIGAIETETGAEIPIEALMFEEWNKAGHLHSMEIPSILPLTDLKAIVNSRENTEGVVVRFESGLRLKIKSEEYLDLFGIITGWSSRTVWDVLSAKGPGSIAQLIHNPSLPKHFKDWLSGEMIRISDEWGDVLVECQTDFDYRPDTESRKKLAEYFKTKKYPAVLFAMLDGNTKNANHIAWQIVRPKNALRMGDRYADS